MEFNFTPEQLAWRDKARAFAEAELAPIAAEIDREARFPVESVAKMRRNGILGMTLPVEYGGGGADTVAYALVMEEIARVCMSTSSILGGQNSLCSTALLMHGSEAQKRAYLTAMGTGEKLAAFSMTEVNAGSDVAGQQTRAAEQADGSWLLNGSKVFVTNGGFADFYLVLAVTEPERGSKGFSVFLVDADAPGLTIGRRDDKMGQRASSTTELILHDCRLAADKLLGRRGDGFRIVMQSLDSGRISVAAQCVGLAQGALDEAVGYLQTRRQFGHSLADNQYLRFTAADMATRLEAARAMLYRAAWKKSTGASVTMEAAQAKLFCSETCTWLCKKALGMFGGYGYTKEFAIERMYRDAAIVEGYEGSAEVQRMVIAGGLFRGGKEEPASGCTFLGSAKELLARPELAAALAEGRTLVCAGRGAGAEGTALCALLAEKLGAELGGTKGVTDADWLEKARMIGRTGKKANCALYLGFGVSGAPLHLGGVQAGLLVAVDRDANAAIFRRADFGIVGDAQQVLRELLALL